MNSKKIYKLLKSENQDDILVGLSFLQGIELEGFLEKYGETVSVSSKTDEYTLYSKQLKFGEYTWRFWTLIELQTFTAFWAGSEIVFASFVSEKIKESYKKDNRYIKL